LVLLAVVLIVALVSVALLGFFPGMASDAQITQSQAYWRSASPIAVTEAAARFSTGWSSNSPVYLLFRNNGAYPIRITKLLGGTNASSLTFNCYTDPTFCGSGVKNISDYYYLAPGEERYLGGQEFAVNGRLYVIGSDTPNSAGGSYVFYAASLKCQNSTSAPGTLIVNNFGFEYIEYIEGQQITKREVGKPLVVKCREPN